MSGCAVPPIQLLVFPARSCASTTELAIEQRAGVVVFGNGHWPVCWHPTPDRAAFRRCSSQLLACRAESARGQIPREKMSRHAAARSRVRGLFASTINLQPDATGTGLRSERHGQPNLRHDALLDPLGAELNRTEPHHPGPPGAGTSPPCGHRLSPPGRMRGRILVPARAGALAGLGARHLAWKPRLR